MLNLELTKKEVAFLLTLLESNRQTALQLLAAEHVYKPHLLPKLYKLDRTFKQQQKLLEELKAREKELLG